MRLLLVHNRSHERVQLMDMQHQNLQAVWRPLCLYQQLPIDPDSHPDWLVSEERISGADSGLVCGGLSVFRYRCGYI
jgi:hypothetical protein